MQPVRNRELVKRGADISLTYDCLGNLRVDFFLFLCIAHLINYDQSDLE